MSRQAMPVSKPVALTIATSDSGGGAGIQADLKTMEARGVFGTSVLCATTAQNTQGVESVHVLPVDEIDAQIDAVVDDFAVGAAKTGMLATAPVVERVAERAAGFPFPLVVDPVMVAATGDRLLEPEGEDAYEALIGEATVVTPNVDEARVLTGIEIDGEEAAIEAGKRLLEMGANGALLKGGHVPGEMVADVLVTSEAVRTITHPRVESTATHGSGCMLASAIAAGLARGAALGRAVTDAIGMLGRAVRYPIDVGTGPGAVHHLVELRERAGARAILADVQTIGDDIARGWEESIPGEIVVGGASAYAERPTEIAVFEVNDELGGGNRRMGGIDRFGSKAGGERSDGTPERVASVLLGAREAVPEYRFALGWRPNAGEIIESASEELSGPVVELRDDRERRAGESSSAVDPAVRQAFEESAGMPVGMIDRRSDHRSAVWVVAAEPERIGERATALFDRFELGE
jgi:hydroxymethylpyrimidine kinase / phosphomethylpyrimidine kinase / thiamine-phosphate diphosphorylase